MALEEQTRPRQQTSIPTSTFCHLQSSSEPGRVHQQVKVLTGSYRHKRDRKHHSTKFIDSLSRDVTGQGKLLQER